MYFVNIPKGVPENPFLYILTEIQGRYSENFLKLAMVLDIVKYLVIGHCKHTDVPI